MFLSGPNPCQMLVTQSYFCLKRLANTMHCLRSVSLRLPTEAINAPKKMRSTHYPDLSLSYSSFDSDDYSHEQQARESLDCKRFKRYIKLHYLFQKTIFLKLSSAENQKSHLHSLYRAKNHCYKNGLKPVQKRN